MARFSLLLIILAYGNDTLGNEKQSAEKAIRTPGEIIAQAPADEWRQVRAENLLILELPGGPVMIELADQFAPGHTKNLRLLAAHGFYDGLAMYRVIDGFVAQGGDQAGERDTGQGRRTIPAEFTTAGIAAEDFTALPGPDGYAPQAGFSGGFPAAREPKTGKTWMTHCYGAVAMAREQSPDSGGTDFYIVIGPAQRYLDRNTTVFGRVISGMSAVQQLARGSKAGGVLEDPETNRIEQARIASQLRETERPQVHVMRTDSASFRELIRARSHRPEDWFQYRPDHVDVCAVGVPVRVQASEG
ncbi:hypothetical protein AVO43_04065 [Microbulbifer sp. ZGT114]|nr:hypothetical protein AVO43_04065 [Microbulbifer sp. ZGT114]